MFNALRKKLIFTISTKVTDTTEKRTHNQEQFKKHESHPQKVRISILMFVVQIL